MGRAVVAAGAVFLAGCARVFGLDTGAVTEDAPVDQALDAADVDAPPCVLVGHDEDGDGIDDGCDLCPTVSDKLATGGEHDSDNDLVGDACDPVPMTRGDHIALFEPFLGTALDAATWMPNTDAVMNGDEVEFTANSELTSVSSFHPKRIAVTATMEKATNNSTLELFIAGGSVSCKATVNPCGNIFSGGCLLVHVDGVSDDVIAWPDVTAIRSLQLDTETVNNVTTFTCLGIDQGGAMITGSHGVAEVQGQVGVQITRSGNLGHDDRFHVQSLIVYEE